MQYALPVRSQVEECLVGPVLLGRPLNQRFVKGRCLLEPLELLCAHAGRQFLLELAYGAFDVAASAISQAGVLGHRDQRTRGLESRDVVVQYAREIQARVREQSLVIGRLHRHPLTYEEKRNARAER